MKKLMVVTLSISSLCAMDNSKPIDSADNSFTSIQSLQDIAAFAGYVVAYKTDSHILGPDIGYHIDSDESVKYGYISLKNYVHMYGEKCDEIKRYELKKLLNPHEIACGFPLADSHFKDQVFLLSNITYE